MVTNKQINKNCNLRTRFLVLSKHWHYNLYEKCLKTTYWVFCIKHLRVSDQPDPLWGQYKLQFFLIIIMLKFSYILQFFISIDSFSFSVCIYTVLRKSSGLTEIDLCFIYPINWFSNNLPKFCQNYNSILFTTQKYNIYILQIGRQFLCAEKCVFKKRNIAKINLLSLHF